MGCNCKKSVASRANDVRKAIVSAVKGDIVTAQVFEERLARCRACDSFLPKLVRCSECGCFLNAKARIKGMSCPAGRWGPVD